MAQTSINIRIDEDIKKEAETLFANLGMNISTAVNIFVRQALNERGIPFKIKEATDDFYNKPNNETLEAMQEAEQISKSGKGFNSPEEMFEDLGI